MRARFDKVPTAYDELEYLACTGTQYIDTGYVPPADYGFELIIMDTAASGSNYMMGSRNGSSGTIYAGVSGGRATQVVSITNNETATSSNYRVAGYKYVCTATYTSACDGAGKIYCCNTGAAFTGTQTSVLAATAPLCIGALRTGQVHAGCRIYSVKFYESGELVHRYVPCRRTSDSVLGLYDTVGGAFYTNAGSGTFGAGATKARTGQPLMTKNSLKTIFRARTIMPPEEYQRVSYLQASGAQYIQLPIGFDNTDKVEMKSALLTSTADKYVVVPRTWNNNKNRFALGGVYAGYWTCGYGNVGTSGSYLLPKTSCDQSTHIWTYSNYTFSITDLGISYNGSSVTFGGTTTNLRIFYGYNAATACRVYYYKHWKNDELALWLIPCYRKSDDEPGLYDLINGVFYTNAGTGAFTIGV